MKTKKYLEPIYALSTPFGQGAISIIRVSGEGVLEKLFPYIFFKNKKIKNISDIKNNYLYHCNILEIEKTNIPYGDLSKHLIDEIMFVYFKGPASYTGEDMLELHTHGSPIVIHLVFKLLSKVGFTPAKPGEFTKRAFLNGKLDLIQAQSINNLINAKTLLAHRQSLINLEKRFTKKINNIKKQLLYIASYYEASLDYPEEDDLEINTNHLLETLFKVKEEINQLLKNSEIGRLLHKGLKIPIIGKTNVGKSSIFNMLLNEDRSIVSEIHGTTRDYIDADIKIGEIPVKIFDTAGIRLTEDIIERKGIEKISKLLKVSDLILFVIDPEILIDNENIKLAKKYYNKIIFVLNKADILEKIFKIKLEEEISLNRILKIRELLYQKILNNKEPEILIKNFNILKSNHINLKYGKNFVIIKTNGNRSIETEIINSLIKSKYLKGNILIDELPYVQSVREKLLIEELKSGVNKLIELIKNNVEIDIITFELKNIMLKIYDLTGENYNDELYEAIFSNFCLGK